MWLDWLAQAIGSTCTIMVGQAFCAERPTLNGEHSTSIQDCDQEFGGRNQGGHFETCSGPFNRSRISPSGLVHASVGRGLLHFFFTDRMNHDGLPVMGHSIGIVGEGNAGTIGGCFTLTQNGSLHKGLLTKYHIVRPSNLLSETGKLGSFWLFPDTNPSTSYTNGSLAAEYNLGSFCSGCSSIYVYLFFFILYPAPTGCMDILMTGKQTKKETSSPSLSV